MHEVGTKADIDSERGYPNSRLYRYFKTARYGGETAAVQILQLENIINAIAEEWRFIKYQISLKPYIFPMEFQH